MIVSIIYYFCTIQLPLNNRSNEPLRLTEKLFVYKVKKDYMYI